MRTRLTLATVAAAVLLLTLAAPAMALRRADTGVPYGWLLQLRGAKRVSVASYTYRAWQKQPGVKATVVDNNKTPDDATDDLTYVGVGLWRLVGRIDDKDPGTFNTKLATTAPGYNVVVTGVDGYSATFTSAEVATLKDALVVADRLNGQPLYLGTASIKNDVASWKPMWPLKLITNDANVFSSRKVGSVERISIVPVEATGAKAVDAGVPYGWLLQLRGAKRVSVASYTYRAWQKQPGVKATVVDNNKTPDDATDDLTYVGVGLWRLVGRIDDKDPGTFNTKLATTAPGYNVVVTGVDGYSATFTSAEVATLKDALVVADRLNGQPLYLGTASIKNDVASWKPMWPLKLITNDANVFSSRKVGSVERISIVPVVPVEAGAPF